MTPHIPTARRAADRARWLGSLAEALDIADKLTSELSRNADHVEEVVALIAQIGLLRAEIDALRAGRPAACEEASSKRTV